MDITTTLALAAGAAWASGINVYAVILMLGVLGATGYMELPPTLEVLMHPVVMVSAGFMYLVQFFADKTPGVDSAWDVLHSFVRVPAGAVLAAAALGEVDPALQIAAFILGGTLAAMSHVTKSASRVLINTSPEPVTNWTASVTEDALVVGGLWTALNYPLLFLALLALAVALMIWLLPRMWRALKSVGRRLRALVTRRDATPMPAPPPAPTVTALPDRTPEQR